jgi:hypothetical protein
VVLILARLRRQLLERAAVAPGRAVLLDAAFGVLRRSAALRQCSHSASSAAAGVARQPPRRARGGVGDRRGRPRRAEQRADEVAPHSVPLAQERALAGLQHPAQALGMASVEDEVGEDVGVAHAARDRRS